VSGPPGDRHPDVLRKVRKLLAKAEATDNPREAEAFSAKAVALIAVHRIDVARLADDRAADELTVRHVPIGRGAYVRARLALLQAIAGAHDAELVWQAGPDGTTALLAGFASDLDAVVVLYESLHLQAATQMATVRRATPAATQRWRRAFLFGFASRIAEVLDAARQRAAGGGPAEHPGAAARLPDLLARAERVEAYAANAFGRVVSAAAPRPALASGWDHGHRAAGRVDVGRPRLPARRAIGRGER
jgi:Protein of unknown function (DUF2786)